MPPVQEKCNFLRVNKLNTNSPKATFYCKLVFFAPSSLPQDTPKVCKSQSRTFPPPKPPPSKTYRGESDIHRFPSSKPRTFTPPPAKPTGVYLSNVRHLWGGDDRDEAERLLDAWTDFNTWTKQKKTQSFDCTFWESFV